MPQLVARGAGRGAAAAAVVPLLRARERGRRRRCRGTPSDASPSASTRARAASRRRRGSSRARRAGCRTRRSTGARASCRSARPRTSRRSRRSRRRGATSSTCRRPSTRASAAGDAALAKQDVVVTVPASFDASARELTVEAALAAGIEKLTLLEEPQAALYAWVAGDGRRVAQAGAPGRRRPRRRRRRGDDATSRPSPRSTRTARSSSCASPSATTSCSAATTWISRSRTWSARSSRPRARRVDRWQQASLVHACRAAKERLLVGRDARGRARSPSRRAARRCSAATLRTELTRDEVTPHARRGVLPRRRRRRAPTTRARAARSRSSACPTPPIPAVTRHLAAFLARQAGAARTPRRARRGAEAPSPDGAPLQRRRDEGGPRCASASSRRSTRGSRPTARRRARVLEGADLDLAVARGACAYALVRRGKGLRIRGGHGARVLRGHRERRAGGPRRRAAGERDVRRAVRHGGGDRGVAPAARAGRRRRRAGALPLLRLDRAARGRSPGACSRTGRRDELEELPPIEVTLPAEGRREGDVVPGAPAVAGDRGGHAAARGRAAASARRPTSGGGSSSACAAGVSAAHGARASPSGSTSGRRTRSSRWRPLDGRRRAQVFDVAAARRRAARSRRARCSRRRSTRRSTASGVEDPFGDAPWVLGEYARRRGAEVAGRLVASSKSWLVHGGGRSHRAHPAVGRGDEDAPAPLAGRRRGARSSRTCGAPGTPRTPTRRSPSRTSCSPCRRRSTRSRAS